MTGRSAAVAVIGRGRDVVGDAQAWWQRAFPTDELRHLPYTIVAVTAIVLLGLVVVPLSIPDPVPPAPRSEVLGEQYLVAFGAPGSPAVAAKLPVPSLAQVTKTYGADGGTACTGSLAEAYELVATVRGPGRVSFDRTEYARMRVAHSVYCPDRTKRFATWLKRRNELNAAAAARAAVA